VKLILGEGRREPVVASAIVFGAMTLLTATVLLGTAVQVSAPVLGMVVLIAVAHKWLLSWRSLLALIVLTILFVPIKRYTLPGGLPFNLELYRVLVAFVVIGWATALLIDPRVRLRASGLEAPLFAFLILILLSLLANVSRVDALGTAVPKTVTFFVSFVFVFYLVLNLARRPREIDFLARVLVVGGAVVASMALIESATGYNVFNQLHSVLPFLYFHSDQLPALHRGGRLRVYASAQHPIALGAALAVILPLAIYRAKSFGQRRWWVPAFLILMGLLATRSRTAVLMLFAMVVVFLLLRQQATRRLWPAILPALIVIHFALPGTIGSIRASFFPSGGLIAQQKDASVGSGRIATLGPALDAEFKPNPVLGEGYGTRITGTPEPGQPPPNGPILDDAWLGILLETGVLGTAALLWLFIRFLRRAGKAAKRDLSPRGWLLVATTASVAGFSLGMFTYDAFSFIQVTLLLFIVLGIGASALLSSEADWERFSTSG
jgi:O-antigen ligase